MLQLMDVECHVTTGQHMGRFGRVKKNTSGIVTDTSTHTHVRAAPVLPTEFSGWVQTRLKTLGEPKHARRDHGPRLSALPMSRPLVRGMVAGCGVAPLRAVIGEVRITRAFWTKVGGKREMRFSGRNFTINSTKFEIKTILSAKGTRTMTPPNHLQQVASLFLSQLRKLSK